MRVGHILNEVFDKKVFIEAKNFDVDFFDIFKKGEYEYTFGKNNLKSNPLYNLALKPIDENSVIVEYDKQKIEEIIKGFGEDILLISGDFWGIQKFIFSNLTSKNASKILRSRSAKIQIITKIISNLLCEKGAKEVLFGAGKFLLVGDTKLQSYIDSFQKELDNYFFKNYFGENGFILSYIKTKRDYLNLENSEELKKDLIKLGKLNEKNKLRKFNLNNRDVVIDIFEKAKSDDEVCEFCRKRVKTKEDACEICSSEIELGKELVKNDYLKITQNDDTSIFIIELFDVKYGVKLKKSENLDNDKWYDISNDELEDKEKWQLKSFVAINKDRGVKTFEELQGNTSGLMALKADVDRLGKTFREFYYTSFAKFNRLSREINFFFANYVPYLIRQNKKYKENIYVIFAGGDDLFLIGRYDVVVELAKEIREKFTSYTQNFSTLSMGLVMFKHNTPITFVSEMCDEAESRAKGVKDKAGNDRDGIDIFGVTMKWDEFLDIENRFNGIVEKLKDEETTTFYYKLIEIIKMAANIEKDFKNALWKSKLNYASRNFRNVEFLADLNNLIEEYRDKLLPSLFLTIYKRRDYE